MEQVFEVFARRIRSNVEVGNPLLQVILRDEARRCDWPMAIHAIICDLPPFWQALIYYTAREFTQEQMAEKLGVSQSGVSAAISLLKTRFAPRVMLVGSAARSIKRRPGVVVPPAIHLRPVVAD